MLHRTHIPSQSSPTSRRTGLVAPLALPPDPGVKAREYRRISRFSLFVSDIKPHLTLPSPSAPTSPGPQTRSPLLAPAGKGWDRGGVPDECGSDRVQKPPELSGTQQNRPSFQHHGQFHLHCPLAQPRRTAASGPGRDRRPLRSPPRLRAAAAADADRAPQLRGAAGGQGAHGGVARHS